MDFDKVFSTVKRHADTLVNEGTDVYGDIHTPLFCYQLDLKTHKPPHRDINPMCVSFDASFQSRCCNMDYDHDTFRMLFTLTRMTGDKTYADAADAYMGYFMEHCVSPTTGLFGWGEHIYYNLFTDEFNCRGHDGHEYEGLVQVWDELYRVNPAAVTREIEAVWEYHIHDPNGLNFDRHAHFYSGHNDGLGFINHGANYVYNFAFLHKVTKNPEYLDWAVRLTESRYKQRDPDTGMAPACVVRDARGHHVTEYISSGAQGGAADFLSFAYRESPHPLLLEAAENYFKASFAYDLDAKLKEAEETEGEIEGGNMSWFIDGLLNVYEAAGDTWALDKAKQLEALTPKYLHKGGEDWGANEASWCALSILGGVRLHKITGEQKWLDIAMDKAQYAHDNLFEGDLFRFTSEGAVSDRYCARTDAALSYAFASLAEHLKEN